MSKSEKPNRMPPLTVVVLRGLSAAMAHYGADIQNAELGDFSSASLAEAQRARVWLDAVTSRAGLERVFPHLKAKRLSKPASIAKRRRVRVV